MSSRTTNYNLIKPDITEKALIGDINNNMDTIDAALAAKANSTELSSVEDGLAILANGNTHAAIASGQAVFVRGHSSLANGLYWAKAAIAQNAALSTSNLTADSAGGLNALKADVDTLSDDLYTLNSNMVNMENLFRCVQYNANADRTVESNRTAAMEHLLTNYFSKHYHFAMVRYSSGYYHGYIFIGEYNEILIVEIAQDISEKVIFWRKSGNTWKKNGAIT